MSDVDPRSLPEPAKPVYVVMPPTLPFPTGMDTMIAAQLAGAPVWQLLMVGLIASPTCEEDRRVAYIAREVLARIPPMGRPQDRGNATPV